MLVIGNYRITLALGERSRCLWNLKRVKRQTVCLRNHPLKSMSNYTEVEHNQATSRYLSLEQKHWKYIFHQETPCAKFSSTITEEMTESILSIWGRTLALGVHSLQESKQNRSTHCRTTRLQSLYRQAVRLQNSSTVLKYKTSLFLGFIYE